MKKWLQEYVYRCEMSIWNLIFPVWMVLLMVLFTIGAKTLKTPGKNREESLRNE
jgi:hypothetical protein